MCLNDWRAGKLIRTKLTQFSLGVAGVGIILADPARVGIMFSGNNDGAANAGGISSESVQLSNGSIFSPPTLFTLATHGDLCTRAFSCIGTAGTFIVGVAEFIGPLDMIQAAMEQFRTEYSNLFR